MIKCIHDLEILTLVWILCHLKLSVPCTKLLIIHVETFQWIILQIIYTTRDILYLIYSEGACQYSNSSLQTRLNIDPPLHCKSKYGWDRQEIHIHIFKKLSLLKKIQKRGGVVSIHIRCLWLRCDNFSILVTCFPPNGDR